MPLNRLFINTAGSGKTRSVFQGLCIRWGFYFTCRQDTLHLGSPDVSNVINQHVPQSEGFTETLPTNPHHMKDSLDNNRLIAKSRFNEILLARLLIFAQFIAVVEETGQTLDDMKKTWLLLQLFPSLLARACSFKTTDIFTELALHLTRATAMDVETHIKWLLNWSEGKLFPKQSSTPFYCAIDEAPAAVDKYTSAFRSEGNVKRRPILREMLHSWSAHNEFHSHTMLRFVVTGTGINAKIVKEAISSAVNKPQALRPITNTNDFGKREKQEKYLKLYLPDDYIATPAGKALIDRVCYWLCGR